jgi:hypothetical protein
MRVGILVVRRICDLLRADGGEPAQIDIVPMDNKENLIQQCGTAIAALLANGCDRVVILWDERPAWPDRSQPLCWHNDRQDILANLQQARVDDDSVFLVCIEREFESWLLFDEPMLRGVLCTKEHPRLLASPPRSPDRARNPKGAMATLFRRHGERYVDVQFARRFAQCLTSLNRLRRCQTFRRFVQFLTDPAGRST